MQSWSFSLDFLSKLMNKTYLYLWSVQWWYNQEVLNPGHLLWLDAPLHSPCSLQSYCSISSEWHAWRNCPYINLHLYLDRVSLIPVKYRFSIISNSWIYKQTGLTFWFKEISTYDVTQHKKWCTFLIISKEECIGMSGINYIT